MSSRPPLLVLGFPFLVFLSAFLVDKLPFIGNTEDAFITTASFLNFDHKERMVLELRQYLKQPGRRHALVLFGNSRTMAFSRSYIEKTYPDWTLFNFSVPGGTTDYFYYLMRRFHEEDIHPEAIYFTVTPQGMNASPAVALDEVMVFGLPPGFIAREATAYSVDDLTNYAAKKAFLVYRYRPKLRVIQWRLADDHLAEFRRVLQKTEASLDRERGSLPYDLDYRPPRNDVALEANAASIWKDYFVPFRLHSGQLDFTERSLRLAHDLGARTGLIWPKVSAPLRRRKAEERVAPDPAGGRPRTVNEVWIPRMKEMTARTEAAWMDFNTDPQNIFSCDLFFDASHMASGCLVPFMDRVMLEARQ